MGQLRRLNLILAALLCLSPVFGDGGYSITNWPTTYQCNVTDFPASYPVTGSVSVSNLPSSQAVTGTFWQATQPVSGSISVSNFPASQAVTGSFYQSIQPVSESGAWTVGVNNYPATQAVSIASMPSTPVTGTFWQATQPISGSISVSNFPASQAVTGTFWPATQPVSGTFWQTTQPVSIASMPSTPVTGSFWQATQPVSGTFWQATQPVSIASMPSTPVTGTFWQATQPVYATNASTMTSVISSTGAAAVATNVSVPAAGSGLFQYITFMDIELYTTAARTGAATPVSVTSTNLPGSMQWMFTTAAAIGTDEDKPMHFPQALRSSASNTATVIKLPSTTGGAWMVNVVYYIGP